MAISEVTKENYLASRSMLFKSINKEDRIDLLINIGLYELKIGKKEIAKGRFKAALAVAKLLECPRQVIEKIEELIRVQGE